MGSETRNEKRDVGDAIEDVGAGIGEAHYKADSGGSALGGGALSVVGNVLVDGLAIELLPLKVGAAAIGGEGEEVETFLARVVEKGFQGVIAHKGVESDGICTQMLEAGNGVAALGFADVGPLDVENNGDVAGDAGDSSFQESEALAAEALEVGAIWLEGGRMGGGLFDETDEVIFDLREAVVVILDSGVETDAKVADGLAAESQFFEESHGWWRGLLFGSATE